MSEISINIELIEKARKARNLSHTEMAKRLGVSRMALFSIRKGEALPSLNTLGLISDVLNIPISKLIKRAA